MDLHALALNATARNARCLSPVPFDPDVAVTAVFPAAGRPFGAAPRADFPMAVGPLRSEEHTSELQSLTNLVCRLLLEKKKKKLSYKVVGAKDTHAGFGKGVRDG